MFNLCVLFLLGLQYFTVQQREKRRRFWSVDAMSSATSALLFLVLLALLICRAVEIAQTAVPLLADLRHVAEAPARGRDAEPARVVLRRDLLQTATAKRDHSRRGVWVLVLVLV